MTIMPVPTALAIPYDRLTEFCERHHIIRLWLFGSVLRGDFRPDSDVDVLVEFDPDHIPGWEIVAMQDDLSALLEHPVDLGTPNGLRNWMKPRVMQSARLIYERTG